MKKNLIIAVTIMAAWSIMAFIALTLWGSKTVNAFTEFFVSDETIDPDASESSLSDIAVQGTEGGAGILSEESFIATDNDDYVVFGLVRECNQETGGICSDCIEGPGICIWTRNGDSKGDFIKCDNTSFVYDGYKVEARGGNDIVRYANSLTELYCWYHDSHYYTLSYDLSSYNSFDGKYQLFWGDAGDDTLYTCSNALSYGKCWTDAGSRRADGRAGNDAVYAGMYSSASLWGGDGADGLFGSAYADTIYGGGGNDRIIGHSGADKLYGDADNDTIYGNDGNDTINGGSANDTLYGGDGSSSPGDGNDCITGGTGQDVLTGEYGYDYLDGGDDGDTDWCWCTEAGADGGKDYRCTYTDCDDLYYPSCTF